MGHRRSGASYPDSRERDILMYIPLALLVPFGVFAAIGVLVVARILFLHYVFCRLFRWPSRNTDSTALTR